MIEFRIKEKTRSLNESFRGNWRARDGVAKRQRTKAMGACPKWPGGPLLMVRVTRVSPRELDSHDNLRGALKHVVDGVASRLKIDDASPLVAWEYHQTKGQSEVVVQIWRPEQDQPPLPVGRPAERKPPLLPSEHVSKALRATAPAVLATVAADAGKRLRAVREPGNGEKRAPREFETGLRQPSTVKGNRKPAANYVPPDARLMRETPIRAAAEAIAQADDAPTIRKAPGGMGMHLREQEYPGPGKRAAAERRALLAAHEAEATFAPAPACNWGHSDCCLVHSGERP